MFLTTLVIVCSITTESFFERIIIYSVTDVFVWAMLNFQFDMKKFFAVFQDSSRDIIYLESSGRQAPIWTHWSILVRSLRLLQKTLIYIQVGSCTQADNPVRNCLFKVNSMYRLWKFLKTVQEKNYNWVVVKIQALTCDFTKKRTPLRVFSCENLRFSDDFRW